MSCDGGLCGGVVGCRSTPRVTCVPTQHMVSPLFMPLRRGMFVLGLVAHCVATGCESSMPSAEPDVVEPVWTFDAPGRVRGVAAGSQGDVVAAVTLGDALRGGRRRGDLRRGRQLLASVPMEVPKACDICTRLLFYPQAALALPDGGAWLGDDSGNLFLPSTPGLRSTCLGPSSVSRRPEGGRSRPWTRA